MGCLAVIVMGAYYVRYSSRRKYYKEDRYSWDEDLADEEQGGGGGEYGGGGVCPVMVTPVKGEGETKSKSKFKSKSQPDDDDDEDSHRTAPMTPMMPMTPEASTSQAATAAAAAPSAKANGSVGVDQIVSDLTRDEAELQNLRRQNSLDQHQDQDQSWLSDGLRQPSATGVEPATGDAGDLAAVATILFVAADFGAGGEVLDGDTCTTRSGFQEPIDGVEEDSSASADSHDESSTGEEEATVTSLAAVSITSSDASALNGNRNTSMTIMKDQLVGSGGGDPFGETGHPSQGAGGGAMVPVPSVNFSA